MATGPKVPSNTEAGLFKLLDREFYDDYFGEAKDGAGDSIVGGVSADINVPDNSNGVCSLESTVDGLLLEAHETFESQGQKHQLSDTSVLSKERSRFADPKSEKDVADTKKSKCVLKTQADTKYCTRLCNEWKMHHNSLATSETFPDDITEISKETLQYWMCCFVLEVQKKR